MSKKYNSKYMDEFYEPYRMTDDEEYQNRRISKVLAGRRKPPDNQIIKNVKKQWKPIGRRKENGN